MFKGAGKLILPGKVEVTAEDGSKQTIQTKNIIIATGSVVRPIPGFETDGKHVVNSDHILELTDIPEVANRHGRRRRRGRVRFGLFALWR